MNRGRRVMKWKIMVESAPSVSHALKQAPVSIEQFKDLMNQPTRSGTSPYYGDRAELVEKAAQQLLFWGRVNRSRKNDLRSSRLFAANKVLGELIDAACATTQLKAFWLIFRGLRGEGHRGIRNIIHQLDQCFLELEEEEDPQWTNPRWEEDESAHGFLTRLRGLAATENVYTSPELEEIVLKKFTTGVKQVLRSEPSALVQTIHDQYILKIGTSQCKTLQKLDEILNRATVGTQLRVAEKQDRTLRPRGRATESLKAEAGDEELRRGLQQLQVEVSTMSKGHQANSAALTMMAVDQGRIAAAGAEDRAKLGELRTASLQTPPALDVTAPPAGNGAVPRSADCPSDITPEMIQKANSNQPPPMVGLREEVFRTNRVQGLIAISSEYGNEPQGKAGFGDCAQCNKRLPVGTDVPAGIRSGELQNVDWNAVRAAGGANKLTSKQVIVHYPRACRTRLFLVKKHVREHPEDAWMVVSISQEKFDAIRAGAPKGA